MIRFVCLVVFCSIISSIESQRLATGACPSLPAMPQFEKSRFAGYWVEVEKTPSVFDFIMRCMTAEYLDNSQNDGNLNVILKGTSLAGIPITIKGDGIPHPLAKSEKSGKYNVRFGFGVPFQGSEMTIIDTDYKEYAVIYSCTSSIIQGLYHTEYIWLMSRDGTLSNPTRQNIYETLDRLKINRIGLHISERVTCPGNTTLNTRESEQNLGETTAVNTNPKPLAPAIATVDKVEKTIEVPSVVEPVPASSV